MRNSKRKKTLLALDPDGLEIEAGYLSQPERLAMSKEQLQKIGAALAELPFEQREVIILHLQNGLKFKDIANARQVSVNTIQSRYRYGLKKLRLTLDGEMEK